MTHDFTLRSVVVARMMSSHVISIWGVCPARCAQMSFHYRVAALAVAVAVAVASANAVMEPWVAGACKTLSYFSIIYWRCMVVAFVVAVSCTRKKIFFTSRFSPLVRRHCCKCKVDLVRRMCRRVTVDVASAVA
ncbi:unnamed protein product [Ceratitis capitata]|uniref:(Mediterranean fruit fly) hypothetical protein n=1 Tax=Ceratitis capitata TaxID=7213 RepID=A0A811U0C4_CERCA|nr:unnamed protein product [Ceratitis capitata]